MGSYVAPPVISGATINECPSETVVLTATAAGATSFTWYNGSTQVQTGTSSDYSATATGIYTVEGKNAHCSGTTSAATSVTISVCLPDPDCDMPTLYQQNTAYDGSGAWSAANTACKALGARLPSITELRCLCVNADALGIPYTPYNVWSSLVVNSSSHRSLRMGTCISESSSNTLPYHFRCVL
ncbi:MAG: hypothetical protein LBF81_05850, partial [Prevotellaceae bacterium]|jgi:hypothetical protein|nr:hypothetical protein [Prevotellaceae bacterium]